MTSTLKFAALVLTVTLATGCAADEAEDDATAVDAPAAAAQQATTPGDQADATQVQKGSATGTVTALDPAASKVTIDHGAVPELQWPAMNMGFSASPAQVAQLEVGQRVEFDFEMAGSQATITRIEPIE